MTLTGINRNLCGHRFRVVDTAKALFNVDYYQDFVEIQSETAIRHVATQYPYDTFQIMM